MKLDRNKIEKSFETYVSHYDRNDPKVELKVIHTYKVAALCDEIAHDLHVSKEDRDLAWLLGMLHDIGRFEQLRRYHTFKDKESIDHAKLSADILFHDHLINTFIDDHSEDDQIETAVRLHNVLQLPELNKREYMCCTILRDADKIDILRVNCQTPRSEIYDLPEEAFYASTITDEVFNDLKNHHTINRKYSKTGIDYLLGHVSFVYGLVYPCSIEIMKKQGYLDQILSFESQNEDTRQKMDWLRKDIQAFINSKDM